MSPSSTRRSRINWPDSVLILIALAGVMWQFSKALDPQSFVRGPLSSIWNSQTTPPIQYWQVRDQVSRDAFRADPTGQGNILATFSGLSPDNDHEAGLAREFYFRATYLMWPRRLFVADRDTIIIRGPAILTAPRPGDSRWISDHDVQAQVEFRWIDGRLVAAPVPIQEGSK